MSNEKLNRPQEPIPPFPYIKKDILYVNPTNNIIISGTLTTPFTKDKFAPKDAIY
jgi:hypothetical protein